MVEFEGINYTAEDPLEGYNKDYDAAVPLSERPRPGRPRLLDRSAPFQQSTGHMNIRRKGLVRWLMAKDWFHEAVHQKTWRLILYLFGVLLFAWLVFGGLMYAAATAQPSCEMGLDSYAESIVFTVITMATIGYGVGGPAEGGAGPYLRGCDGVTAIVMLAAFFGVMLDAVILGIFLARISRGTVRASTIVFSDKALIQEIRGRLYFTFRVAEMRKHQLDQARIRLYCVRNAKAGSGIGGGGAFEEVSVPFQSFAMRLQQPDDNLGSMLLLAMPQHVVHRIDAWSPLAPPGTAGEPGGGPSAEYKWPDSLQREFDYESGNREDHSTKILGREPPKKTPVSTESIVKFMKDTDAEIIVLLEGTDSMTAYSVAAKHSYRCEDVVLHSRFDQCVGRGQSGECEINFAKFHKTVQGYQHPPQSHC